MVIVGCNTEQSVIVGFLAFTNRFKINYYDVTSLDQVLHVMFTDMCINFVMHRDKYIVAQYVKSSIPHFYSITHLSKKVTK